MTLTEAGNRSTWFERIASSLDWCDIEMNYRLLLSFDRYKVFIYADMHIGGLDMTFRMGGEPIAYINDDKSLEDGMCRRYGRVSSNMEDCEWIVILINLMNDRKPENFSGFRRLIDETEKTYLVRFRGKLTGNKFGF